MGVTETGIAVALRVVGVVCGPDVPGDLLGPVAGYNNKHTGEGRGDGRGDQMLTYDISRTRDGDGACVAEAMVN